MNQLRNFLMAAPVDSMSVQAGHPILNSSNGGIVKYAGDRINDRPILTVACDNGYVLGDYICYIGNKGRVRGDYCIVKGNDNEIRGDHCVVHGDRNRVIGTDNDVRGNDCTLWGLSSKISGTGCTFNNVVLQLNRVASPSHPLPSLSVSVGAFVTPAAVTPSRPAAPAVPAPAPVTTASNKRSADSPLVGSAEKQPKS